MGTDENKAVVSGFMNEVTTGGNLDPDLIDELCGPDYVNVIRHEAGAPSNLQKAGHSCGHS